MTKEAAFIKLRSLPVEGFGEEVLCLFRIELPWKRESTIYFSHIHCYLNTYITTHVCVCVCVCVLLRLSLRPYHLQASFYVMRSERNAHEHRRKKGDELCCKWDCSIHKGFRLPTWLFFCHMHLGVTSNFYSEHLLRLNYILLSTVAKGLSADSVF